MRQKTGKVWQIPLEQFKQIVSNARNKTDACKMIGSGSGYGRRFKQFTERCLVDNIDTSHFTVVKDSPIPLSDILKNGTKCTSKLKARLLKDGLLENICVKCGIGPVWNGEPLVLQLDHIDGNKFNNELLNLRIVCPNCHTQTPTFGSKRGWRGDYGGKTGWANVEVRKTVCDCGALIAYGNSGKCRACASSSSKSLDGTKNGSCKKFNVSTEELTKLVSTMSLVQIGKQFGVSDTAVRKRCIRLGISWKNKGHFASTECKVGRVVAAILQKNLGKKPEPNQNLVAMLNGQDDCGLPL